MKNSIIGSILVLFFSFQALAQGKDELKVASRVEQLRKAMIDPDPEVLDGLVMPMLSYGHSSGVLDNKAIFIDKLVSGKSDFVSLEFSDQSISLSGNVALVRHTLTGTTNDSNVPGQVKLKVLLVWQKDKSNWKLLARQAIRL